MTCAYQGRLSRNDDGTLAWKIRDSFGWVISGTAVKDGASYRMEGVLGPTPEALQLPGETEMREPT